MTKNKSLPDQFKSVYSNYSKDLWDFLTQNNVETDMATYLLMINKLREYSSDELITIKQLIKINNRKHPLLKPLLSVVKSSVKLLASFGLFSIISSSLRITNHIKFVFTEHFFVTTLILFVGYILFLLLYEMSIVYIENKKWFYIKRILVELIDYIVAERNGYSPILTKNNIKK